MDSGKELKEMDSCEVGGIIIKAKNFETYKKRKVSRLRERQRCDDET